MPTLRPALLVSLACALSPGPAAAGSGGADDPATVAVLPAVGDADDSTRKEFDSAIRQALLDAEEIDLQASSETKQHVLSLAELGMVCVADDLACLVKLGVVASVQLVMVPTVDDSDGKEHRLELSVIDVEAAARARTVDAELRPDDTNRITTLVRRALGLKKGDGTKDPPDAGVVVDEPDAGTGGDVDAGPAGGDGGGALPGAIVTGVGGVVGAGSLVGALVCDMIYLNIIESDAATRQNVARPLGAILWVGTILGGVAAAAGVVMLISSPGDNAPEDPGVR